MPHNKRPAPAIRHPAVAFSLAFVISLSLTALLIAGLGALPTRASTAARSQETPQQVGLEIQNQVQDKVLVYQELAYTVVFTNNSDQTLYDVTITDTWTTDAVSPSNPAPAEYNGNLSDPLGVVDSYTWTVGPEAGALYIYVGTLTPRTAATLVFTMGVPDSLEPNFKDPKVGPSLLGNSVDIGTSTSNVENAYDTDTTHVVGPVLKLDKTAETELGLVNKERPGRLVTYTLSLRNLNAEDDGRSDAWPATRIEVWDDIPGGLAFIGAEPPGQYIASAHRISWTMPADFTLNPGETTYFTFTVRVTTTESYYAANNKKINCSAIADERLTPAHCSNELKLNVLSPLEKRVETRNPPSGASKTFPGRTITYTVFVYNPLQVPVDGLRVTDTLPSELFTYVGMVGSGPLPTGAPTSTIVWEGLSLPANGAISFAFHVFVDEQTPLGYGCRDKEYKNKLSAAAPAFPVIYKTDQFDFSHVYVTKQIKLSKSRTPSAQLPGELVTYTIKIENLGDTSIDIPSLTDTLPIDFRYHSMVSTPPGEPAGESDNVIWWDDLTLGAGEVLEFSFRATVDGVPLSKPKNGVNGFSPDTYICGINTAQVEVLSPIVGSKEANPPYPEPIVQGESFEYTVSYANRSSLSSFFISEFQDSLPAGFEKDGSQLYSLAVSDYELQPDQANSWHHNFNVRVAGKGTGTDWCDDLATEGKRKVYQEKGTFGIHTTDLAAGVSWVNAAKEAPVYVKPHVDLLQSYDPSLVGLGGTTLVTLSLVNNVRSPAQAVNDITVTYELRDGLTYLGVVSGTPEPDAVGASLTWYGIDLPASGRVDLHFQLQAPSAPKLYWNIASSGVPADLDICIPVMKKTLKVVRGVTLRKTPKPKETGPFGTVEYNIEVKNLTDAPATGIRITDTLPPGFTFVEMVSDHSPASLAPLVWEIPTIAGLKEENIKFKARTYVNLGPQYNHLDGVSASTYVTLSKTLEEWEKDVRVDVVPGVGLYKTVEPAQVQAGQPVTYTINLYNGSNKDMANIVLTDTLPDGFSFGAMLQGTQPTSSTGSLVVWHIAALGQNQTLKLIFRADTELDLFSGLYYNQVSGEAWDAGALADPIDVPSTDLTAPVDVHGLPTVQRAKSVSPSNVQAGNLVTYTITLHNEMDDAQTLRLTDTLPVSLTFDSVVGATPQPLLASSVVWQGLNVGAHETMTLVFRARVDFYALSGVYYNRLDAAVAAGKLPPVGRLAPLSVQEVPRYDLQVSKSDGQVTADAGDLLAYTITYTNANAAGLRLTDVVITDTFGPLPPYADPSGLGAGWSQVASNVFTYAVGDLEAGASGSVQFSLQLSDTIPPAVTWVISNTAAIGHRTAEPAIETESSNDRATDLDILHGPDLIVTGLQVSPAEPETGEPTTFSATVRNQGKDDAGAFIVELYLKGSAFTPAGPPGGVFDHAGGYAPQRASYACASTGLAANDEQTCTFVVTDVTEPDDYDVYVQIDVSFDDWGGAPWGDAHGAVMEAIESNNVYSYGVLRVGPRSVYLPIVARNH